MRYLSCVILAFSKKWIFLGIGKSGHRVENINPLFIETELERKRVCQ